jgi:SAM-dependent methyltransferase
MTSLSQDVDRPVKALTDAQLNGYRSAGYVFPIPALSAAEVMYFRACLEDFLRRRGWPLNPRWRHKPHLHLRWVNDLGRHPKVLDAVEDLLGPDLMLLNSWFFIKPAHDTSEIPWHRDSLYGLAGDDEGITAWIALTDSTSANGCVRFAAATHRDPLQRRNRFLRGESVPDSFEVPATQALVPAGQMSLHHVRVAHCSGPNATAEMRAAIALRYLAGRSTPRRRGEQATPVRGRHTPEFEVEPQPRFDDDPLVLAWHARSFRRYAGDLLIQAVRHPDLGHVARQLRLRYVRRRMAGPSQSSSIRWMAGPEARSERQRWDKVARSCPDPYQAATTQYYRRCEIALVKRHLGDARGKSVLKLDLWNEAVNTHLLQWMEGEGARVFGIDLSAVTTGRARRNFASEARVGHFAQADIRSLPFADASFDLVYTMGTIEHVREYELAIREVCRVLRPAGTALIGVPHKWDPFLRPVLVWILERLKLYPYSPERAFGAGELRAAVERSGLTVQHRTGLLFVPGIVRLADLFLHVRGARLERLTSAATRPFEYAELRWEWARRLGYLVAVVARKVGGPDGRAAP